MVKIRLDFLSENTLKKASRYWIKNKEIKKLSEKTETSKSIVENQNIKEFIMLLTDEYKQRGYDCKPISNINTMPVDGSLYFLIEKQDPLGTQYVGFLVKRYVRLLNSNW